ncbi:hypothetical protein IAI10_17285 [Clostridium sp. 19966]|uniref:nuclear transport factor 2 family protein n=1 Tax=Clostridium sp. 19966 TaxID=2768166 RepID=UPI0028DDFDE0|nr:nuclear transport factor 2 family protein [Clostridium sp. 19966]MDT8718423.1 hypothetical protein [Clostridium sp. 19966]
MNGCNGDRRNFGKGNANEEVQYSVRNVLKKFQNGYSKRDINLKDSFVEELFWDDNDTLIVGTGDGEWCLGNKEISELIEIDWVYWGDFIIDIDGAIVSSYGDVAWVTTEGVLKKKLKLDKKYDNCVKKIRENLDYELESKDKLVHILKSVSNCLYEGNLGEEVVRPVRFSAILVNKNDIWKFHNIHFSYHIAPPTDIHIIEGRKIY